MNIQHSHIVIALVFLIYLGGASLSAQSRATDGISQSTPAPGIRPDSALIVDMRALQLDRSVMGLGGGLTGIVVGGVLGYKSAGTCRRYSCDYHGLPQLALGSLIGSIVGTAALASGPRGYNNCTRRHRFKRGLIGATIGSAIGVAILTTGEGGPGLVAIAFAPPIVAAQALRRC